MMLQNQVHDQWHFDQIIRSNNEFEVAIGILNELDINQRELHLHHTSALLPK